MKNLIKVLFAAGARELYLPTSNKNNRITKNDNIELKLKRIKNWDMLSVHSMSANRMGRDSKSSITDIFGKVHNIQNLFVVDSSSLPSSVGESPQGVIMSNSLRISKNIFKKNYN